MAVTSGTYNFLSTNNQQLIDEAWEMAGLLPDVIVHQKIVTALRSANLVLTEWINKGYNLWTSSIMLLNLNENQGFYTLPNYVSDVIDVNARTFQTPLNGAAISSAVGAGNPNNCFGGNGGCILAGANGFIGYNYGNGVTNEITMVGVLSGANANYTLNFEYSSDNVTWTSATLSAPSLVAYTTENTVWTDMTIPNTAQYFRIRESGGAILNINQLYFATNVIDTVMARISGSEYMTYPDKELASKPSVFWLNRVTPQVQLVVWPVPQEQYQVLQIRFIAMLQDVGALLNTPQIPARFYDAFVKSMAHRLALKKDGALDVARIDILKKESQEAYSYAATEDTEKVPLRLIPSYLTGWSYV